MSILFPILVVILITNTNEAPPAEEAPDAAEGEALDAAVIVY